MELTRKKITIVGMIAIAVLALIFIVTNGVIKYTNNHPIKAVKVIGKLEFVDPHQVESIVKPQLRANFFDIDIDTIKSDLLSNPWVQSVIVTRQWPGNLVIKITENKPVAIWNHKSLLNQKGQVFAPDHSQWPDGLLVINGPADRSVAMLDKIHHFDKMLKPVDLTIVSLDQSPSGDIIILLNNGITIMVGRKFIDQRIDRFVRNYPKIIATDPRGDIVRVDLRYDDALAVKWA